MVQQLYINHSYNNYCFFYSATTKKIVAQYEEKCDRFLTGNTVDKFKKLFPDSATSSELEKNDQNTYLKLKLRNRWGKSPLSDLFDLVRRFDISDNLHLSKVAYECIAVVWLFSTSNAEKLKGAILEAADSLLTMGVLQVFIGEELVLECIDPGITWVYLTLILSSWGMYIYTRKHLEFRKQVPYHSAYMQWFFSIWIPTMAFSFVRSVSCEHSFSTDGEDLECPLERRYLDL